MKVTSLKLANVRTIEAAEFRFQPGFNLIVGVNCTEGRNAARAGTRYAGEGRICG